MKKLIYLFIRMWAPPAECTNPREPHFVASIEREGGETSWTVTRIFEEAHYFKELEPAERVVQDVARISDRVARGWLFEIIRVEEAILSTNVPTREKKSS